MKNFLLLMIHIIISLCNGKVHALKVKFHVCKISFIKYRTRNSCCLTFEHADGCISFRKIPKSEIPHNKAFTWYVIDYPKARKLYKSFSNRSSAYRKTFANLILMNLFTWIDFSKKNLLSDKVFNVLN